MTLKNRWYCIVFMSLTFINHSIQPTSWQELKKNIQKNPWTMPAIIGMVIATGGILYSYIKNILNKNLDQSTQSTATPKNQEPLLDKSNSSSLFERLVQKSNQFAIKASFPTANNRIQSIANGNTERMKTIGQDAQDTKIIMHTKVATLINDFLAYKKEYGTTKEKALYEKLSTEDFIKRLIIKRPLMFMTANDSFLLCDGSKGSGGFESIGTPSEKSPLTLDNYLSYEEMEIAALLSVSVPSYFINNGSRDNEAQKGNPGTFEEHGVYVGAVGARFEKPDVMEWKHMVVTKKQNTYQNGYGAKKTRFSFWKTFYNTQFVTYDTALKNTTRFVKIKDGLLLDTFTYKKRLRITIEPFLLHANATAQKSSKKAYCHVVGLGLGVWQLDQKLQTKLMLEVYEEILKDHTLTHISDIDFSYFNESFTTLGSTKNNEPFTQNGNNIMIHFSKRNPADPLKDNNKLLVAMYAWDGNSYPGNEYWAGMLTASGDPAAACCSTIPELQNPLINEFLLSNKPLYYGI